MSKKVSPPKLKARRESAGLTQEQVARMMPVSRVTPSRWETGFSHPRLDQLVRFCEVVGCDLDDVLEEDEQAAQLRAVVDQVAGGIATALMPALLAALREAKPERVRA